MLTFRLGSSRSPVRARAVFLGLALVPLLCWWSIRTEIISGGSELIEASLLAIVVFTLFVLVVVNDVLLRRFSPRLALSRAEILVVYVTLTTSVGVAGLGQMQFLNQALAGVYVHATPENDWANQLQPHVPSWWVPDPAVLPAYFKGNSSFFTPAHMRGWGVPILVWTGFIATLLFAFLCLNTLLRRHWMEYERLGFPLVQIPLELTREGVAGSLLKRGDFWLAFLLACAFRSITGLHRVEPSFPDFAFFGPKGQLIDIEPFFTQHPWNAVGYFRLSFHPMIVGLTYFLPLDVSFSTWFFYLAVKAENVLVQASGWRGSGTASPPYTAEQGAGAFLALAVFSLWGARRHLARVFRKAWQSAPDVRDDDEPLSYRTAVWGLAGAFTLLAGFAVLGGLPPHIAVAFFALYLLMIVAVTRLRAEAGPMLSYGSTFDPHQILVNGGGSRHLDAATLTPFAYFQWFDSDYRTVAMPQQMEAFKIGQEANLPARGLARLFIVAGVLATVAAFVSVLAIYYHYGASTPRGDNGWRAYNGRMPFQMAQNWLQNPLPADLTRLEWMAAGFAAVAGLVKARTTFLWWPFHPAGFALAHAGAAVQWVWTATLLGWLAKALVLRYGGMRLYRRGIPFFLGLVLGDIVIASLWSLLGVLLDVQMYMFFPG